MSQNLQTLFNYKRAEEFLSSIFPSISDWQIKKIAGDASFRSYYRIYSSNSDWKTKILMYAPPDLERTDHFILVDNYLISIGLHAPQIIASDVNLGFLILEDFGDLTFSKFLANNPNFENSLYKSAIDVLIFLQNFPRPKVAVPYYNNSKLFEEVKLFSDWYVPMIGKNTDLTWCADFKFFWFQSLDLLDKSRSVLVLRDFHADNLMVLNNQSRVKSVGLLDFQDALIGSPAYDLVSLLEDARRDVSECVEKASFEYYLSSINSINIELIEKKDDEEGFNRLFKRDYEILSLQRNLKILGIFSRLAIRDGKKQYLQLIPRVKNLVLRRLSISKLFDKKFKDLIVKMI